MIEKLVPDEALVTHEAKSLSMIDRLRLQMHITTLRSAYSTVQEGNEKLALEEVALSSLRINDYDLAIQALRTTIFTESDSAWTAFCTKRLDLERKAFHRKGDDPPASEVKTPEMASEIVTAWETLTQALKSGKMHLVSLDEILNLLRYEGFSTRIDHLAPKAFQLVSQLLAIHSQKADLLALWMKISQIRDRNTISARFNDCINEMPDQAAIVSVLSAYATERQKFWAEKADTLKKQVYDESLFFRHGYQGARDLREQLRFVMTCRRQELTQQNRLRRVLERLLRQRQQDEHRQRNQFRKAFFNQSRSRSKNSGASIEMLASLNPLLNDLNLNSAPVYPDQPLADSPVTTSQKNDAVDSVNTTDVSAESSARIETPAPENKKFATPAHREAFIAEHKHVVEPWLRLMPSCKDLKYEDVCAGMCDLTLTTMVELAYLESTDLINARIKEIDKELQKYDKDLFSDQPVLPLSIGGHSQVQAMSVRSDDPMANLPRPHLTKKQKQKLLEEKRSEIRQNHRKKPPTKPPD